MKKLALLFGFLALTSQLPFCPYYVLPGDVASSLEYGREWTGMFLQAYGITDAEPAQSSRTESPVESPTLVADAAPMAVPAAPVPPTVPCPYEAAEPAIPVIDADFPVIVESVTVSAVSPVAFTLEMTQNGKLTREEFRIKVEQAMKEARKTMQRDLKLQETITAARKSKAQRHRLITVARSA